MESRRQLASKTGLYTLDVFIVLLNYEIARMNRYPGPLTLLQITLAMEGQAADIRKLAKEVMTRQLASTLRISDVPAHYNDDFLVLLPATDENGGRAVAERILSNFRTTQSLATGRLKKKNAYVGVTSRNSGSTVTVEELMAEAAVAMNEGRARDSYTCVVFSELDIGLPKRE
ncbi:MAG: diguanylate cyclase domain-containing protein [Chloroflexota bacterium]